MFSCDFYDWEKVKGLGVEVCTIHSLLQQDDRFKKWSVLGQKKDKHIYIDTLRRYALCYQSEGTVKLPSIRRRKTRRHNKRTLDQRAKVMRDTDDGNKKDGGFFFFHLLAFSRLLNEVSFRVLLILITGYRDSRPSLMYGKRERAGGNAILKDFNHITSTILWS